MRLDLSVKEAPEYYLINMLCDLICDVVNYMYCVCSCDMGKINDVCDR